MDTRQPSLAQTTGRLRQADQATDTTSHLIIARDLPRSHHHHLHSRQLSLTTATQSAFSPSFLSAYFLPEKPNLSYPKAGLVTPPRYIWLLGALTPHYYTSSSSYNTTTWLLSDNWQERERTYYGMRWEWDDRGSCNFKISSFKRKLPHFTEYFHFRWMCMTMCYIFFCWMFHYNDDGELWTLIYFLSSQTASEYFTNSHSPWDRCGWLVVAGLGFPSLTWPQWISVWMTFPLSRWGKEGRKVAKDEEGDGKTEENQTGRGENACIHIWQIMAWQEGGREWNVVVNLVKNDIRILGESWRKTWLNHGSDSHHILEVAWWSCGARNGNLEMQEERDTWIHGESSLGDWDMLSWHYYYYERLCACSYLGLWHISIPQFHQFKCWVVIMRKAITFLLVFHDLRQNENLRFYRKLALLPYILGYRDFFLKAIMKSGFLSGLGSNNMAN